MELTRALTCELGRASQARAQLMRFSSRPSS